VEPGERILLQVPLRAPVRGGNYRLVWDMVHENVTWFGARNPTEVISQIHVIGDVLSEAPPADSQVPATATTPLQFDAPIPGRRELWSVALQLFRMHPLTGIGLDNFRLSYGRFLSQNTQNTHATDVAWNNTIHTNNWYLELLVSAGLLGSLPFFVWSALLLSDLFQTLAVAGKSSLAAVAVCLLTYFIHGLLDYFMLFNVTALLFWILVGLWLVAKSNWLMNNE
jgi:O-antigen ligase